LLLLSFFCFAEKRSEAKKTKKTEEAEKDKRQVNGKKRTRPAFLLFNYVVVKEIC
jgi:hypothetical protein